MKIVIAIGLKKTAIVVASDNDSILDEVSDYGPFVNEIGILKHKEYDNVPGLYLWQGTWAVVPSSGFAEEGADSYVEYEGEMTCLLNAENFLDKEIGEYESEKEIAEITEPSSHAKVVIAIGLSQKAIVLSSDNERVLQDIEDISSDIDDLGIFKPKDYNNPPGLYLWEGEVHCKFDWNDEDAYLEFKGELTSLANAGKAYDDC